MRKIKIWTMLTMAFRRFFVIDNRPGLAKLCAQSIKTRDVEKALIFLDILEKQGLEIKV